MNTPKVPVPDLKPHEDVQRALLSTTSRLYGMYEGDDVRIDHAWPGVGADNAMHRWSEGPTSRSTYVLSFYAPGSGARGPVPEYEGAGEFAAATLSVLYGKRVETHGALENCGFFRMPDVSAFATVCHQGLPNNTHVVRADIGIPLNLVEARRLTTVWSDGIEESADFLAFSSAARFYQRALIAADTDPEVAYLHLITAGEILAQDYIPKSDDQLLDAELEADLGRITQALADGGQLARMLRKRLFEVKRRYVAMFNGLVDRAFFDRREATEAYAALRPMDFAEVMGAAYDLRSQNVHRGEVVGHWLRSLHGRNEIQLGRPVVPEKELAKALARAPTWIGLERVTRYVLLRSGQVSSVA